MKRIAAFIVAAVLLDTASVFGGEEPVSPAPPPPPAPAAKEPTWEGEAKGPLDKPPNEVPQHLVKILRTTNKAQTNRYVPKAYEFKNVNPYSVRRMFQRVIEQEEGSWFTFLGDDGKSGVVVVSVPEYQIPYLDRLMAAVDIAELTDSSGEKREYKQLKHRTVSDPVFFNAVKAFAHPFARILADVETNAIYIQDTPSGTDRVLRGLWEQEKLDVPREQVEIEASVYEIDLTDDGTMGLDFHAWKNGPGRNAFAVGYFYENARVEVEKGGSQLFSPGTSVYGLPAHRYNSEGGNFAYYLDVPSAFFDFLVAKNRARISASTRLTALNQDPALFETAEEILYYEVETGDSTRAGGRPSGIVLDPLGDRDRKTELLVVPEGAVIENKDLTVLSLDPLVIERIKQKDDFPDNRAVVGKTTKRTLGSVKTGVFLSILPTIGTETVQLKVDHDVVNHIGWSDDGKPILASRSVLADAQLREGQELILGGLVRERVVKTTRKIPVLGSLPILGWLFGGEVTQTAKSLVVVVLTPRLGKSGGGRPRAEDKVLMDKAEGKTKAALPGAPAAFDTYLLGR